MCYIKRWGISVELNKVVRRKASACCEGVKVVKDVSARLCRSICVCVCVSLSDEGFDQSIMPDCSHELMLTVS